MKLGIKITAAVFFFAISCNLYALDFSITGKSAEACIRGENNDSFGFFGDISAIGELELNNMYKIRSGISYGRLEGSSNLNLFALAKVYPFTKLPLDFSLLWVYNGFFAYELHSNSILPFVSYNWKRIGISLGYNFRFTSLLGEASILEASPAYSFIFTIINGDKLCFRFIFGNFNEFIVRNSTDYSYNFSAYVRIDDNWQFINEIDFLQSGGIALTETFFGISIKMGVRYSW